MKFYTLSLLTILFTLLQAEVILIYKFKTPEAKALFDEQKGTECVHNAIIVQDCGKKHLANKDTADSAAYEACIKSIGFHADFESEALALQTSDFQSKAIFEDAYQKKLVAYAKKLDGRHSAAEKPATYEFSMNWAALLILPFAFGIVYFFNRKSVKADAENSSV